MAEKPIVFCGELIPGVRDGRITQTRRVMRSQPSRCASDWSWDLEVGDVYYDPIRKEVYRATESRGRNKRDAGELTPREIRSPYQPGDILWVREAVQTPGPWNIPEECKLWYPADGHCPFGEAVQTRSSRFMPKWAARIWLEVVETRAQRLQDIGIYDIRDEGVDVSGLLEGFEIEADGADRGVEYDEPDDFVQAAKERFADLWNAINAKRGYPWTNNNWVWAYTLKLSDHKAKEGEHEGQGRPK